jgi:DNA-binding CsgD family transcriptional regulator
MSLISLAFAGLYDGGRLGLDLVFFMTIMTILTYIMSGFSQKAVNSLQQENTVYQDTLNGLLRTFHMTRQELIAYAQLSRNKKEDKHIINAFFSEMDKRAEHNIIEAVKIRMAEIDSEKIDLAKRYPDFTPTEIEVCKYIIEGNSQKDIARITGKSESNVSTVRGRIRKKLGLKPDEDLRTKLME